MIRSNETKECPNSFCLISYYETFLLSLPGSLVSVGGLRDVPEPLRHDFKNLCFADISKCKMAQSYFPFFPFTLLSY